MQEGSDLVEHVNIFNQMVADLAARLEVTIGDEDKAIILLCSLPSSYEHVITTLTYGKESIKTEIAAALLARELRRKNNAVEAPQAEGLLVSGEPSRGNVEAKSKRKKKV